MLPLLTNFIEQNRANLNDNHRHTHAFAMVQTILELMLVVLSPESIFGIT
jgi:hypothetical protein